MIPQKLDQSCEPPNEDNNCIMNDSFIQNLDPQYDFHSISHSDIEDMIYDSHTPLIHHPHDSHLQCPYLVIPPESNGNHHELDMLSQSSSPIEEDLMELQRLIYGDEEVIYRELNNEENRHLDEIVNAFYNSNMSLIPPSIDMSKPIDNDGYLGLIDETPSGLHTNFSSSHELFILPHWLCDSKKCDSPSKITFTIHSHQLTSYYHLPNVMFQYSWSNSRLRNFYFKFGCILVQN